MSKKDLHLDSSETNKPSADANVFIRMILEKYGCFDRSMFVHLSEEQTRNWLSRRNAAKKNALDLLRIMHRPIRHQDLLDCMEVAILTRMDAFEKNPDTDTALMLTASIICKNILMDGPLH